MYLFPCVRPLDGFILERIINFTVFFWSYLLFLVGTHSELLIIETVEASVPEMFESKEAVEDLISASIKRYSVSSKPVRRNTTTTTTGASEVDYTERGLDADDANAEANEEESIFFQTAVNIEGRKGTAPPKNEVRLPVTVNAIALRETLFSEAPFVVRQNKAFWRRMVDSKQFSNILSAAYNHIAPCITENGMVNIDKLNNVKDSWLVQFMATNMSDMIFSFRRHDRDIFFGRLPEVVTFMVSTALHTSMPKHYRIYHSVRFREIVLDWCTEILWGMRLTNNHYSREWLFSDCNEMNIMISQNTVVTSTAPTGTASNRANASKFGGNASSCFSIEYSPLVQTYIGMHHNESPDKPHTSKSSIQALKITMSHQADRPLMTINSENVLRLGRAREKKVDMDGVRQNVKLAKLNIRNVRSETQLIKSSSLKDLRGIRSSYKEKLTTMKHNLDSTISQMRSAFQNQLQAEQLAASGGNVSAKTGGTTAAAVFIGTGTNITSRVGTAGALNIIPASVPGSGAVTGTTTPMSTTFSSDGALLFAAGLLGSSTPLNNNNTNNNNNTLASTDINALTTGTGTGTTGGGGDGGGTSSSASLSRTASLAVGTTTTTTGASGVAGSSTSMSISPRKVPADGD